MFQDAIKAVFPHVVPVLLARRMADGKAECQVAGAIVMINDDGWFMTAGHLLQEIGALAEEAGGQSRRGDRGSGKKRARVTHFVPIFGTTRATIEGDLLVQPEPDIGFGKLKNYPALQNYPKLRSRAIEQGEFLCRLGFPFTNKIPTTWTKERGFNLKDPFPVPAFVNEAMVSRFASLPGGGRWIETSSPGLRGQSGGPLIDAAGLVCGLQVNTGHYDLGFEKSGRNQVLNVGRAVHVDTIRAAAHDNGIHLQSEEETND